MGQRLAEKAPERRQGSIVPAEQLAAEIGIALPLPVRLQGAPLRLEWGRHLHASRGKLRFGHGPGMPIHAASFLRERRMVLDRELKSDPGELARIALHEIFHFVWIRLNNRDRRRWELLLLEETFAGARGELGWSAEMRRTALRPDDPHRRTRRWREYVCESFCDSAAWLFSGLRSHPEFTLPSRFRPARRRLLRTLIFEHHNTLRI